MKNGKIDKYKKIKTVKENNKYFTEAENKSKKKK